ncbi:hypothetical protein [Limnofasciculus baicalensis]|uniref:Uncharacterized protein n=1 Tax=Limnofasciculus baicalensis BBK-W-15 TaxID=2699891 RepID=A0AAE3GWN5_9CYAN|nr:hypothetical protein [Limnofasciculus baicalensis]MCP2731995.1 hypothetical protein [Limnofasciculus baicalensis BBK-W-15]
MEDPIVVAEGVRIGTAKTELQATDGSSARGEKPSNLSFQPIDNEPNPQNQSKFE